MAFVAGGVIPDLDLLAGLALQGDPMALHRRFGTHTLLTPAVIASVALLAGRARARRGIIVAAGAALHLAMDVMPWVYVKAEPTSEEGWLQFVSAVARSSAMDIAAFGTLALAAWALTSRRRGA